MKPNTDCSVLWVGPIVGIKSKRRLFRCEEAGDNTNMIAIHHEEHADLAQTYTTAPL